VHYRTIGAIRRPLRLIIIEMGLDYAPNVTPLGRQAGRSEVERAECPNCAAGLRPAPAEFLHINLRHGPAQLVSPRASPLSSLLHPTHSPAMRRLTALALTLLVVIASVFPTVLARETNADRLRRGYPPLPPSRRDTAKRAGPSVVPPPQPWVPLPLLIPTFLSLSSPGLRSLWIRY